MTLREFKEKVLELPVRFDNLEVFINHPSYGPHQFKVSSVLPVADDNDPEEGPFGIIETFKYPTYILVR